MDQFCSLLFGGCCIGIPKLGPSLGFSILAPLEVQEAIHDVVTRHPSAERCSTCAVAGMLQQRNWSVEMAY